MPRTHSENAAGLIDQMAEHMKQTVARYLKSGAVDVEKFKVEEFALAKILVTAAAEDCKDDFRPFDADYRAMVKNLRHF